MRLSPRLHPDPRGGTGITAQLLLPASLERWLLEVHGAEGFKALEVDHRYVVFVREVGGGLCELDTSGQPDAYGWMVFSWDNAVAATEGGYERYLRPEDPNDTEVAASRASLVEAGIWMHVGSRDRHDHFLCCDRRRAELGMVYDLNDGHPALGNVYDSKWLSFAAYVAGRTVDDYRR